MSEVVKSGRRFLFPFLLLFSVVVYASPFNWPVSRGPSKVHDGYDYAGPCNVAVPARAGGVVTMAESRSGYGKVVAVETSPKCRAIYGHLSSIHVRVGANVKAGQTLGLTGKTGRVSVKKSCAVLHYESCSSNYPNTSKAQIPTKRSKARGAKIKEPQVAQ